MNTQHTKAPWEIEYDNSDCNSGGQWYNVGPAKVEFPYNCGEKSQAEAKANTKLIAAAPELLEALKDLVIFDNDSMEFHNINDKGLKKAVLAIKKATS